MKLVFLNSQTNTPKEQKVLEDESRIFGDIVQCDVEDGHRRLGYKILCGHIWSHQHCAGVKHVIQSDDSVIIDTDKMVNILMSDTETEWENLIACPTKTHRARVRLTKILAYTGAQGMQICSLHTCLTRGCSFKTELICVIILEHSLQRVYPSVSMLS